MKNKDIRGLTEREINAVPKPIAKALDLQKVEIHCRRWTFLTPPSITVARGYRVYWPNAPMEADSISQLAHLVHEIVHVWQYNVLRVGLYSPRWLDRRYGYTLQPGDQFLSYGLEQQASLIEDAFLVAQGYGPRRARNAPQPHFFTTILNQI